MKAKRQTSIGQSRGEEPRSTDTLHVEVGGRSYYIPASWGFELVNESADTLDLSGSVMLRHRSIVKGIEALVEKGAELEEAGKLTAEGIADRLRPDAAKLREKLQEIAEETIPGFRSTIEQMRGDVELPGADSPHAAEIRAALRAMPRAERMNALSDLTPEEMAAVVSAPPLASGIDRQRHAAFRLMLTGSDADAPFAALETQVEALVGTVERARPVVDAVAPPAPKGGDTDDAGTPLHFGADDPPIFQPTTTEAN